VFRPVIRRDSHAATHRLRALRAVLLLIWTAFAATAADDASPDPAATGGEDYREPSAAVTRLLTATPPPEPILHARSGRVALLFREPVIRLERLARPRLGLAGFRFDPRTLTSGVEPLITRVEILSVDAPAGAAPVEWRPGGGALLDHVRFSPDGRTLSALAVPDGPARLALFDVETGEERILATPVNPAWGDPCRWVANDALLCRLIPADRGAPPPERPAPSVIEHGGGPAPVRTYSNLLENPYEDALFEHHFGAEIARVGLDGRARSVPGLRGLIESLDPSPEGAYAVVTRIERPFSRLVPARRFSSVVEVWDLARGERRYASSPSGFGVDSDEDDRDDPRLFAWKPGAPITIGWIERARDPEGARLDRWMALSEPFGADPTELARSERAIRSFAWTTAGTPLFTTATEDGRGMRGHAVLEGGQRVIAERVTADRYGDPGRALRLEGSEGPVLEEGGRIFLAGDGLGPGGPQPFLDALDLRSGQTEHLFSAEPGVFEVVLGVLDPSVPSIVTSRETESEPPNLYLVRGASRTALRPFTTPYPELAEVDRRVLGYSRADGVALSGTLYLPRDRRGGERLPTLVWVYPYEFSDREHAEQLDVRSFRFHRVKGPSPLAAVIEGYAVLLNPTVPILQEEGALNDDYIPQLVASVEAALDHLVSIGVTDPARVAVAGRSYGAFSSANLLIHSRRFATAVAMSGAYNRTLTPFGFQHEKRSFWEATDLYTRISPFFHADRIEAPLLLVHGGADENPGTPPLQARRFFHALAGEGARVRYVELPHEGHHYWARENVLQAAAELIEWLDRTIGPEVSAPAGGE
jgi:dipeptidyl aminopeptidase/acylaminoacyl peptidase